MRSRSLALLFLTSCTSSAGTELETWDGVTAYVWGGKNEPVYARSGTDASYDSPGIETDRQGFQCYELAVRYFYFVKGVKETWRSKDAWGMCADHPDGVSAVTVPRVGDLMVMRANDDVYGTGSQGHVAIVRAVRSTHRLDLFNQRWGDETTAFVDDVWADGAECFLRATP